MTRRGRPPKTTSRAHKPVAEKPTIQELEAILDDKEAPPIEILPNGEVRALGGVPTAETPDSTESPATSEIPQSESDRWAKAKERRDAYQGRLAALGAVGDQKLVAPTRAGFRRYWGNDEGNNLAHMQNMGYDFVHKGGEGTDNVFSDDPGDRISQLVGTQKNGGPLRAYLLEIPEGWYLENQESKEQRRREVEKDLKRASHDGGSLRSSDGSSVAYIPEKGSSSHFDV